MSKVLVDWSFLRAIPCPNCGGQGWYVVPNRNTGDQEQEQCRWCAEMEGYLASTPGEADQRDAAVLRMIEAIAPETVKTWRAMLPTYEAGQAAMSAQSDTEESNGKT